MSVGATPEETAGHLHLSRATLYRHYATEIKTGTRIVHQRIALGVTQRALRGDNAASFFILKTQAGWREVNRQEHSGINGASIPISVEGKIVVYIPANGRDNDDESDG